MIRNFTRQELRNEFAREIQAIRYRQSMYRKMCRESLDVLAVDAYARSASACSASIEGILGLVQRLGLARKKRVPDIPF